MANIRIKTEEEAGHGWLFTVEIEEPEQLFLYEVTLNWSDYDLWSHGQVAPERVVRAAFVFLLSREPADAIFKKFDCAVIRRYFADADREIPKCL